VPAARGPGNHPYVSSPQMRRPPSKRPPPPEQAQPNGAKGSKPPPAPKRATSGERKVIREDNAVPISDWRRDEE
jgi:hypothetical protein